MINCKQGITKNLQYKHFKTTFFFELDGGEQIGENHNKKHAKTLTQHQKEHVRNWMQHKFSKATYSLALLSHHAWASQLVHDVKFCQIFFPPILAKLAKIGAKKEERLKP
jgi:hypothetical protein